VATLRIPVGVEVETRPSSSRWQDRVVRVVGVRPGAPAIAPWRVLSEEGGVVRYYAGTAKVAVRSTDTKVYKDNVEAREPSLYVVLRKGASPTGWILHLVTVDPSEAHAHVDVGDDLVEALPMPPPLRDWLAMFVARHHVERTEWKRKRDEADESETPATDGGGFLGRWSQRKRQAVREAGPDAAPAAAAPLPETAPEPASPVRPEAALPDLESLGPESDYRAFLQAGVPKALRNAALRRAWSSAPAIRNHRPLVDYDWDFNAPGYGKPLPTDDPSKLTASLFRHLRKLAEDEPKAEAEAEAEAEEERRAGEGPVAASGDAPEDPREPS
jgi:hypothetical protein